MTSRFEVLQAGLHPELVGAAGHSRSVHSSNCGVRQVWPRPLLKHRPLQCNWGKAMAPGLDQHHRHQAPLQLQNVPGPCCN